MKAKVMMMGIDKEEEKGPVRIWISARLCQASKQPELAKSSRQER